MQTIETDYKPSGALGAWYAGANAANAQNQNDEELQKLFLANQQSQAMNPLELQLKQLSIAPAEYEQAVARAKQNSPTYIPKMLSGYEGQMDSQIAAGKFAQDTNQGKIDLTNTENAGNLILSKMQQRANELKQNGIPTGGGVGFPIQNPQQAPTIAPNSMGGTSAPLPIFKPAVAPANASPDAFSWKVDPQVQLDRDKTALLMMLKEWEKNPNDQALNADIIQLKRRIDKQKAKIGDTATPTPTVPEVAPAPIQVASADVPKSDANEYERLMGGLVDTVAQRQALQKENVRLEAQKQMVKDRAAAQLAAVQAKIGAVTEKAPKSYLESIQRFLQKEAQGIELTAAEQMAKEEAQRGYDAYLQSRFQPGITTQVSDAGKVSVVNKTPPAGVSGSGAQTKVINGVNYVKVPGGWKKAQ